ncbi:MAG: TetR/AcrR family transcriptional regulator [Cystobacter sp.]
MSKHPAPTSKPPRQRNRRGEGDRLRAEIIAAAIRVLERLGPDDPISLRAVAKEAKISPPSVYLQFSDMTPLMVAVLEQLINELSDYSRAAEDAVGGAGGGPWDRLRARSLAYVRFGLERNAPYKVLYEGRALARIDDVALVAFTGVLSQRNAELIRECMPTAPDPDRLALLLWTSLYGMVSLRINKPILMWPDADELAVQILRALVPEPT